MTWNIAPECVSIVMLGIIWIYARKGSSLPTLKNRLFQGCLAITFGAMTTNIISTIMIQVYELVPIWLIWLITTIYFILTPLMGMIYFLYSVSILHFTPDGIKRVIGIGMIPGCLYVLMVLMNPFTKHLFFVSLSTGYIKGPLIIVTYLIFYAYCIASMIMVLIRRKQIDKETYHILASFPVIAVVVIIVQQLFPETILSGTAATSALLIIYLHLQNRQIAFDYLTNVPNRQEFMNMMWLLISKKPASPFAVIVLSLRDFKEINNTCGQHNGDLFLKTICHYLCTITDEKNIYRFNGDEFAILLRNLKPNEMKDILITLQERMSNIWTVKDYSLIIPASYGVAYFPESASTLEGMVDAIEYAIARAKNGPYGSICYCGQEMAEEIRRKQQIIQILKQKLAENSFELYYQPIITVDTEHYSFAESLLRIPDSPIGPIYPSEFIPIAESTGMIVEMTYQILNTVCRFINHLTANQIHIGAIHVNFSAIQFSEKDLADKVSKIIMDNGTPFSKIKIEFTESTLAENTQIVTKFVYDMVKKGLRFGLDDFGTGYSNYASVIQIPFGTIKLDKSMIWLTLQNSKSAIMAKNITRTFHELGMSVLAEGVETEEQKEFVKECGMDYIQGFYYARPMPAEQFEEFFRRHQTSDCSEASEYENTSAE